MRKNRISHTELRSIKSQEEGLSLLSDTYNVEYDTLKTIVHDIRSYESFSLEQYKRAARTLYTLAKQTGMDSSEAYAQVTGANLAVLLTDCHNPDSNIRFVNKKLRKLYTQECQETQHISGVSYLRQDLMHEHDPNRNINALETPKEHPLEFSYQEQTDGFRLPYERSSQLFYLLGVYKADGNVHRPDKYEFYLSGRRDDFPFYQDILEDIIDHEFNITTNTYEIQSVKKDSITRTPRIDIQSKNHFRYLQEVIDMFDADGSFKNLDFEALCPKERCYDAQISYLMGLLAGGGNFAQKSSRGNSWYVLTCKDKDDTYVSELRSISEQMLSIRPSYTTRGNEIMFSKKNVYKLREIQPPIKVTIDQEGLFTNPRHIDMLDQYF